MINKKSAGKKMTIDKLAIMIQEGFAATASREDLLILTERVGKIERHLNEHDQKFDAVFYELKEIRREIKEVDTRADVVDLQIRVSKLEKRVKTQ
jgi:ribosomal protein S15P/S13E